jgi:predicted nucleic acid-binding protein
MEKKLKIYLDTSIINFLFADDAPEKKEVTGDFFENYLTDYDVYISENVIVEINKTSSEIKKSNLLDIIKKYNIKPFNILNDDILQLAQKYIEAGILAEKKFDDAIHIAFATYYEFDILLSWNFKDIANVKKQISVDIVNKQNGFMKTLLLLNPYEVIYEK